MSFAVLAFVAFAVMLFLARDMGFRGDDWDLVVHRSLTDPGTWLNPFNEQWIAVPAVIFRAVFAVVGMHSYLPYLAVLLLLHILVAAAIRQLVARLAGPITGFMAGTLVLFLGVGSENLTWAFQIGMVGAVAAGLWALDLSLAGRRPRTVAILCLVSVASHAIGVVFLAMVLLIAVRTDPRRAAWLAVPVLALAFWLTVFDLPAMAARGGSFVNGIGSIPAFVAAGFATAAGASFGLGPIAGVGIIAALVSLAIWRRRPPRNGLVVAAALIGLTVEYGLIALSRSQFGLASVGWSRYLYVAVPLFLLVAAAWFGGLDQVSRRWQPSLSIALAAMTCAAVAGNLLYLVRGRDLQLEHVHRARAAAAITLWADDLHAWQQDYQLPPPDVFRALIKAHGSPARDDLVPIVVPPVPLEIADEVCRQLVPGVPIDGCLSAVRDGVGTRDRISAGRFKPA